MRIKLTSVFVRDQDAALQFYTEVLGFEKKQDVPLGQFKWLTVVSAEEPDGPQLLLEPDANPAAKSYKASIYEQGIPAAAFEVADVRREYERLQRRGVDFRIPPTDAGTVRIAVFDDTCGNLTQIYQPL